MTTFLQEVPKSAIAYLKSWWAISLLILPWPIMFIGIHFDSVRIVESGMSLILFWAITFICWVIADAATNSQFSGFEEENEQLRTAIAEEDPEKRAKILREIDEKHHERTGL